MSRMQLMPSGERQILVTRAFGLTPRQLYRAHVEPALIRQWVLGPPGWSMPVCICEARAGGHMRFEWLSELGKGFYLTGEFIEVVPDIRIVHVERMHLPEPTPDNHIETSFEPNGGETLLRMRMSLPDTRARDRLLVTGMASGMELSYERLAGLPIS
ncbi:MAG: SRPBCC domain-containing protein [Proteobacteria bacterium]|nr:SRPBCC domain-containing protein [Pseudomonadota bacterium]